VKTIPTANINISSERWEKKLHIKTNSTALFLGGLISSKTLLNSKKYVNQIM